MNLSNLIAAAISVLLVNGAQGAPTYRYTCDWENSGAGTGQFSSIAMSANGTIQAATASDHFYYSNDSGSTFSKREMNGFALDMSADGLYITASCAGERFVSNDSGLTWNNFTNTHPTTAVGLSASGKYQLISGEQYFMTSDDFGHSWTEHLSNVTDSHSWVASVSDNGLGQVVGYSTNTSFVSFDFGENFIQDSSNQMTPGQQVNQFSTNNDSTNAVIAADGSLYQTLNHGSSYRTIMNGIFNGAVQSKDSNYHLITKPDEYMISDDNGLTWTVGDGLPSLTYLGMLASSYNGSKVMMVDYDDQYGAIYEGSCGWSFNPYVTATVVDQESVVVGVQAVVEIDELIYV